jgi:acyl-CoA reductase-like NAD-dependent aldehyde dehydrogenase
VAGNAVILKPSERAPGTGQLIGKLCEQAGLTGGELQIASGGPEVARALIEQRPDMIFFTGGERNGRDVLASAARNLIPVILELGGKDPMIVFADADLERAAPAAVYGAFAHAGQHCVSVKRLYVEDRVYDEFLERVAEQTRALAASPDWGRVVDDRARAMASEQVREASAQGARLLVPDDISRAGSEPTLVSDAAQTMRLVQEETFAPVLVARRFSTEEEATELANDSPFGLNASVWSRDMERCERVVRRLDTGNVYVNNVLINIGNPFLPFGGVKASGLGRYHGAEGIRAFCVETSVMTSRSRQTSEANWFPHGEPNREIVETLIDLRYGKMSWYRRITGWLKILRGA